ncbi:branched-chain amino acid transport system substrate-binding protein [Pseudochelatococcus lubricantis]|uniref:Branched-chain amino acid transport system substrate-binding protein n=1 Tax=Pseudochelatococcus lubricantis TaxID=1538102 RepID=A0ABX0UZP5_9HYPH|nr:ABC transporter substrate-binding protein [Pseudochelatococcus lubricantis]NIJ58429.1 branched-chain amino acid transport system substrate-binding protein [Pseudochelatococcus lubricantis]
MGIRTWLLATTFAIGAMGAAEAQVAVKLGVLNDRSGVYADLSGEGSVVAAQLAVEDFKAKEKGIDVSIISADHQNKPDIGSNIARQWYDRDGVDVILDVPTSSVALAVSQITREKNKILINSGAGATDLTGKQCSPNTIHWTYDTYALGYGTGTALVKRGGDTWFFLTADYAFGHALERDTAEVVKKAGGKVLGQVRHPFPGSDFSSFLLQAQASQAKVIGLANAGGDTINAIKQASEFGIVAGGQTLAGLLVFLSDVHALGLEAAQGLVLTEAFYWDQNDGTRAWSERFAARHGGSKPTMVHAGVYAGTLHYLKAVEALKSKDTKAVLEWMRANPSEDPLFGKGEIRVDGRHVHDMYLFEVKKPSESKGPWDYYNQLSVIPAAEAFRPLDAGGCELVKKS